MNFFWSKLLLVSLTMMGPPGDVLREALAEYPTPPFFFLGWALFYTQSSRRLSHSVPIAPIGSRVHQLQINLARPTLLWWLGFFAYHSCSRWVSDHSGYEIGLTCSLSDKLACSHWFSVRFGWFWLVFLGLWWLVEACEGLRLHYQYSFSFIILLRSLFDSVGWLQMVSRACLSLGWCGLFLLWFRRFHQVVHLWLLDFLALLGVFSHHYLLLMDQLLGACRFLLFIY